MKKKCFSLCLMLSFLCLFGYAFADLDKPDKSSGSSLDLEEMVVTAGRVEEKKKEITSNITVIDEFEIKMSSANNLGDLLAESAVGHIHRYPGALTAVGIRGFRTETHGNDLQGHILILINGRRAGTGNTTKISTDNIERIEIIRGPAAAQYGSAAIGGVINVITKRGTDVPKVFVKGMLGSFGYEEWGFGFTGKIKAFDFAGSFSRSSIDDYDISNAVKYENTGFDKNENMSLNIGFEFLPKNRIGVIYNRFDGEGISSPDYFDNNDLDDYKDTGNESVDFIYEGKTNDGFLSWSARYFKGEDEDKWMDPPESDPSGYYDDGIPSEQNTDQNGAQAQVSVNWTNYSITAGFDWVNYDIENAWDPTKTEFDNPAFFILGKTKLLNQKLILSAGLRYDKYEVEVQEPSGETEKDDNLSPKIGIAYLIRDYLKIRANYAEGFKMPDAKELAANYPQTWSGRIYKGNPNLDPEKSKTYEAGLDFSYNAVNTSLTYFHTDFEDKIVQVDKTEDIISWENVGEATVSGFEGEFSIDLGWLCGLEFEIKPHINFVYLTEYEDEETHEDLNYMSDLLVSYGITLSDYKDFFTSLNVSYTGEQMIEDWGSDLWPTPVINKGGFTFANFTIGKKIFDSQNHGAVTLRGEIQNLLDKRYGHVKDYPMPGRSFFLGLKYEY